MVKPKAWVGIDPGAKGAIAIIREGSPPDCIFFNTTDHPSELYDVFLALKQECQVQMVMVEDVHSIYGTSAKSNFNFGHNLGVVRTIPMCAGLGLDKVQPKKWQKDLGVPAKCKDVKNTVKGLITNLYPDAEVYGPKGGYLDGHGDALAIAHYCRKLYP